jgi:tetratricopeptide (TPR) repeat protein
VCVVSGQGGTGKTATVVRAAHRLAEHYPDGQLFVDLHGFTQGAAPLEPPTALSVLLRAVGTTPAAIPKSPVARAAGWRATVAGRRQLVVLDNAARAEQVEPLLPATPGSLTIVTSRNDLATLPGTRRLPLGRLGVEESLALLAAIVGRPRVAAEPEAAARVARYCGGLPLALRIVAGRMATRPSWGFAHVVRRLRDEPRRLQELRDLEHNIATVFDMSVQALAEDQDAVFTRLGTMLGGSIDLHGAAAMLGLDTLEADDHLQALVGAHLVDEVEPDHYRLHDLTRVYARSRAEDTLAADTRGRLRDRLADYYLLAAMNASEWLGPRSHDHDRPEARFRPPAWEDRSEVLHWFEVNRENLAAAEEHLAAARAPKAWHLAQSLWRWYAHQGETELWLQTHHAALAASRERADDRGTAVTLTGLGIAHYLAGDLDQARLTLEEARGRFSELGDRVGIRRALGNLGIVYERLGLLRRAAEVYERVLVMDDGTGCTATAMRARVNLAVAHAGLGEFARAREHCAAVLADGGESVMHANALRTLGEIDARTGEPALAEGQLRRALRMYQDLGDLPGSTYTHSGLAVLHRLRGDITAAEEAHRTALELSESSGLRGAEAELRTEFGLTLAQAERYAEAAEQLHRALRLAQETGQRHVEGRALLALGRLPEPQMEPAQGQKYLEQAAALLDELEVPEAEEAHRALKDHPPAPPDHGGPGHR